LIDEQMPVVVIAPKQGHYDKIVIYRKLSLEVENYAVVTKAILKLGISRLCY
jgi:hypothetical protein